MRSGAGRGGAAVPRPACAAQRFALAQTSLSQKKTSLGPFQKNDGAHPLAGSTAAARTQQRVAVFVSACHICARLVLLTLSDRKQNGNCGRDAQWGCRCTRMAGHTCETDPALLLIILRTRLEPANATIRGPCSVNMRIHTCTRVLMNKHHPVANTSDLARTPPSSVLPSSSREICSTAPSRKRSESIMSPHPNGLPARAYSSIRLHTVQARTLDTGPPRPANRALIE